MTDTILHFPKRLELTADFTPPPPVEGDESLVTKMDILAYTGVSLELGLGFPVVVDLSSYRAEEEITWLLQHDPTKVLGTSKVVNDGQKLTEVGSLFVGASSDARRVATFSAPPYNYRWQASIGVEVGDVEFVETGETRTVNGREFTGPFLHAKDNRHYETSILPFGADNNTRVRLLAARGDDEVHRIKVPDPSGKEAPVGATIADLKAEFGIDNDFILTALEAGWDMDQAKKEHAALQPKPATIQELKAELGDEHRLITESIENGWTIEQARAAYVEQLKAQRDQALQDLERPALPVPGRQSEDTDEPDVQVLIANRVRELTARGITNNVRTRATREIFRENPELHKQLLASRNPGVEDPFTAIKMRGVK